MIIADDIVWKQEPMSWSMQMQTYSCHGVFIDRFVLRSNLLWMRLPWECHNQSQDTNWRHCVTGPELPFFHRRKGELKIDQSVKMPWHRLSMGVASSCSSAPDGSDDDNDDDDYNNDDDRWWRWQQFLLILFLPVVAHWTEWISDGIFHLLVFPAPFRCLRFLLRQLGQGQILQQ